MFKPLSTSLVPLLLSATALAAGKYPPAVDYLIQSGVRVESRFSAPSGMTGYVITFQDKPNVMYLTPDKQHVIIGVMLDANGHNLSQDHLAQHTPVMPDYESLWARAEKTTWVAEGAKSPKSVVYVIADPFCPYCHALWKASQPYQAAGLQIRWILVGYLHPDSAAKAAAILGAEDPELAFKLHETAFAEGGIELPEEPPAQEVLERIRANTLLMDQLKVVGTPAILYRNEDDRAQLLQGMPKLSTLPTLFKLPEQALDDPTLERFR